MSVQSLNVAVARVRLDVGRELTPAIPTILLPPTLLLLLPTHRVLGS